MRDERRGQRMAYIYTCIPFGPGGFNYLRRNTGEVVTSCSSRRIQVASPDLLWWQAGSHHSQDALRLDLRSLVYHVGDICVELPIADDHIFHLEYAGVSYAHQT